MWTSVMLLSIVMLGLAPPDDAGDYPTVVRALESEVEKPAGDQASIATLNQLLDRVGQFPDEAQDEVADTVLRGWVRLARLYLAEPDEVAARNAMDEAIRTARGQPLGAAEYGHDFNQFYKDRRAALVAAGTARIEVECDVPCKVVINERLVPEGGETLFLGVYRVWVKADDRNAEWKFYEVVLRTVGGVETVECERPKVEPTPVLESEPVYNPPKPKRMLPRAAELVGLAAGVGVVIAGAILLSYDGKCESTKQRPMMSTTEADCRRIYESTGAGWSLVGVGGGLLVISGVVVGVDEVRVGAQLARQVAVGVSLRF